MSVWLVDATLLLYLHPNCTFGTHCVGHRNFLFASTSWYAASCESPCRSHPPQSDSLLQVQDGGPPQPSFISSLCCRVVVCSALLACCVVGYRLVECVHFVVPYTLLSCPVLLRVVACFIFSNVVSCCYVSQSSLVRCWCVLILSSRIL